MELEILPSEIKERLRTNIQINTFSQCVSELVLNSLDAKSTSIAVRLNLLEYRIQVIDNGVGIAMNNMESVGVRYMTSRCRSLTSFERKCKYYGHKGESLASIISATKRVEIVSRFKDSNDTYIKTFNNGENDEIVSTKQRAHHGTTVTVVNFLYNYPIRQNRVKSIEIDDVKKGLEYLAIIHPNVSITLRNDQSADVILNCHKSVTVSHQLCNLYTDLIIKNFHEIKVEKEKIYLSGVFYMNAISSNKIQLFYVNKLPIVLESIEKKIKKILQKELEFEFITQSCYPAYVINIQCPYSEVDVFFDTSKYSAEFKSFNTIVRCIEKMIKVYVKKYKYKNNKLDTEKLSGNLSIDDTNELIDRETREKVNECEQNTKVDNQQKIKKALASTRRTPTKQRKTLGIRRKQAKSKPSKKTMSIEADLLSRKSPSNFICFTNVQENKSRIKNYLLGIFDEHCDSQILTLNKYTLQSSELVPNNEKEGKKVVMENFFKSLENGDDKHRCGNEILGKLSQSSVKFESAQSFSELQETSEPVESRTYKKYDNEIDISTCIKNDNNNFRKRQLEKLNSVATTLIEKKLKLQLRENTDENTKATLGEKSGSNILLQIKTPESYVRQNHNAISPENSKLIVSPNREAKGIKRFKSVGISPFSPKLIRFRRHQSEKGIQTSFAQRISPAKEAKSTQVNFFENFLGNVKNHYIETINDIPEARTALLFSSMFEKGVNSKIVDDAQIIRKQIENSGNHQPLSEAVNNLTFDYSEKRRKCTKISENIENVHEQNKNYNIHQQLFESKNNHIFENYIEDDWKLGRNYKGTEFKSRNMFNKNNNWKNSKIIDGVEVNCKHNENCAEDRHLFKSTNWNMVNDDFEKKRQRSNNIVDEKLMPEQTQNCAIHQQFIENHNKNVFDNNYENYRKSSKIVDNAQIIHKQNVNFAFNADDDNFTNPVHQYGSGLKYADSIAKDFSFKNQVPKRSEPKKCLNDLNDMTFNSHYNSELVFKTSKNIQPLDEESNFFEEDRIKDKNKQSMPILKVNTETLLNDLSFKLHKKAIDDHGYQEFKEGLRLKNLSNKKLKILPAESANFVSGEKFNEDISQDVRNMSRFVNESRKEFKSYVPKKDKREDLYVHNKKNKSIVIDTSIFNTGFDNRNMSNIFSDVNGDINESQITFHCFEPEFKSTLKEDNRGLQNNYFESFIFEDTGKENSQDCFNVQKQKENYIESDFIKEFEIKNAGKLTTKQENLFTMKKRIDFLPKGLSPILNENKKVDVTLSPISRKNLNNAIIEAYESELDLIKWEEYLDQEDPKDFFDKLYAEKQKRIEKDVPNIHDKGQYKNSLFREKAVFSKDIFCNLFIIGQLDKKFIVTLLNSKLLLLFDQHAVHERIRLERLYDEYLIRDISGNHLKFKSMVTNRFIRINFSDSDIRFLKYYKNLIEDLGFDFDIRTSFVEIKKIPECLQQRNLKDPSDQFLCNSIQTLLKEQINLLQETKGVSSTIPKLLQYIISNEACRGAIKFGRSLNTQECIEYIRLLSKCQLPFQCAHGRPTLYPVCEVNDVKEKKYKINLRNLYKI